MRKLVLLMASWWGSLESCSERSKWTLGAALLGVSIPSCILHSELFVRFSLVLRCDLRMLLPAPYCSHITVLTLVDYLGYLILLPPPPTCWAYRPASLHLLRVLPGIRNQAQSFVHTGQAPQQPNLSLSLLLNSLSHEKIDVRRKGLLNL